MRLFIARQNQPEFGSDIYLALDLDVAAHCPRKIPADREAEPRSLSGARKGATHLHERLEDRLELVSGNSGSGVSNDDDHIVLAPDIAGHGDRATRVGELDRVGHEVKNYLFDLIAVGAADYIRPTPTVFEAHALTVRLRRDHEDHRVDDLLEGNRSDVIIQLPRLDLAEVEDVVDDSEQVILAPFDAPQLLLLLRRYWTGYSKRK